MFEVQNWIDKIEKIQRLNNYYYVNVRNIYFYED